MSHFAGKDALSHILEKKEEIHGSEIPRPLALGLETASETAFLLLLLYFILTLGGSSFPVLPLIAFSLGWTAWKTGRAGWLGWTRLERLHRLIEQEKYEIEHHRPQEREELVALYRSKGFEGKLLNDVVDVLMADSDRLLKVMLEEEMGLTLGIEEHPLKLGFGAFLGAFTASTLALLFFYALPAYGVIIASFLTLSLSALLHAWKEKNRLLDAVVWNLAVGTLSFGIVYFLS